MGLSWAALNPRKILKLFKRPQKDEHAQKRQRLFPSVPPVPKQPANRWKSSIADRLIRRTHGTAAKPVLCAHTITITATSDLATPQPPNTVQIEVPWPVETPKDITEEFVGPAQDQAQETGGRKLPLLLINSGSVAEALVGIEGEGGVTLIFDENDQIDLQDGRTTDSTGSIGSGKVSRHKDTVDTPATTESIVSSKEDKQVKSRQPSLSAGDVLDVAKEEKEHQLSVEVDNEDDEDDDYIDPDDLRADWVPLEAIPQDLFRAVLLQHLPNKAITLNRIQCTDGVRGGNSIVRFLEVDVGPSTERYVVKVPSVGTAARWQDSDAYMLRNDARTMLYIRKHTDVPCPEVLGFNDSLNNVLGAPYTIMRANKGISSNNIWFDRDEDGDDDERNASVPDEARMRVRLNFLRSLATYMAKLQTLEFDCAGTLNFDDDVARPSIGPTYHWKPADEMVQLSIHDLSTPKSIECIPVHQTSNSYFLDIFKRDWPLREDIVGRIHNGRRFILGTMLSFPPFNQSKKAGDSKETFVLRHDDLDFQNILCDEEGNVTGIIDWDKCRAAPRCIGFASLPAFLVEDWAPGYSPNATHQPWELAEYRNVYACAMLKATGPQGDGKYTINSAVYEAVNAALYGGHNSGSVGNLVHRMLKCLETTRMFEDMDVLTALAKDWDMGRHRVEEDIARFIEPQSHVKAVEPWFWVDEDDEL